MGSSFSAELLELIDNRLEYQVMTDSERVVGGGDGCWFGRNDDNISLLRSNPPCPVLGGGLCGSLPLLGVSQLSLGGPGPSAVQYRGV